MKPRRTEPMPGRQRISIPFLVRRRSSMFDKVSRLAERAAVGLSRRAFLTGLGRIGLGAMAFATFVGEAAAGQFRFVLNGGCCGGSYPYQLLERLSGNRWY